MLRTVSGEAYVPLAEFQVSADTLEYQSGIAFAKLGDGGFVAVWSDSRYAVGSMRMQRFDINGSKVGAEIVLPSGHGAALAPTPSGGFLLTWTAQLPYPTSYEVRGQFYDGNLNPLGPEIAVNTRTDGFQFAAGVTPLAGGGYVVLWEQPEDQTYDHVRAQVLDAAGNKVGGEIIVTENAPGDKYSMGLTALAGGGFVAVWNGFEVADQYGNLSPGLRAQVFDSAGSKVGAAFSLNSIIPGEQSNAEIAALPSGGFVAAWTDDGTRQSGYPGNGNQGVWVQLFDSLGQKSGSAVQLGSGGDSWSRTPAIATTSTSFLVFWPELSTFYAGQNEVRAQRFDFAGNKLGEAFVVGAASVSHLGVSALVLDSGAILLGWTQRATSGYNFEDVHAQLLFPAAHGTDGADSYAGAAGRDFYFGRGGNDTISGGADYDGLSGGDGDDVLNGGDGNDILDGGTGADFMTGGSGNDFYSVDHTGDAVNENEGEGTDTIETSLADHSAPGAVENLTGLLGAGATQTLRGNALSNILTGGEANNIFHVGSGGHDTVAGGGGRDKIYIDWSDSVSDVTSELLHPGGAANPSARYSDGSVRSVFYTSVEDIEIRTGSGNDSISTNGFHTTMPQRSAHVFTGTGDDIAYLSSTLDSFDGGSGIDGVYTGNVAATDGQFVWRVPANQFISPAGTPQLANIEYFIQGVTGNGDDIVETGHLARADTLYTVDGDDVVTFYHGHDSLSAGGGFDRLIIDWSDTTEPVRLQVGFHWWLDGSLSGRASSGTDRSVVFDIVEHLTLRSGSANDSLAGSDLGDRIEAGGGDDVVWGNGGDDVLFGDLPVVGAVVPVSGHDILDGGAGDDVLRLDQGGNDTARGGSGKDAIIFGSTLTNADVVNGGSEVDQLSIQGDYWGAKKLTLGNVTNVEQIILLAGSNTAFGDPGTGFYSYELTTQDLNVAAGGLLQVDANQLRAGENFTFNGAAETDGAFFVWGGKGVDSIVTGAGNDGFLFRGSGNWGSSDVVNAGAGIDQVGIRGNYVGAGAIVMGANQLASVEQLVLMSGSDIRFGRLTAPTSYDITMNDGNVASGQRMTVDAASLREGETLTFNAAAELDGAYTVFGGRSADTITGGSGADVLRGARGGDTLAGGDGADRFVYRAAAESTGVNYDTLVDLASLDRIDLPTSVSGFAQSVTTGQLNNATFDADLAAALDGVLEANQAVLFTASTGDHAGKRFLIVDGNGDGAYTEGTDYVFALGASAVIDTSSAAVFV